MIERWEMVEYGTLLAEIKEEADRRALKARIEGTSFEYQLMWNIFGLVVDDEIERLNGGNPDRQLSEEAVGLLRDVITASVWEMEDSVYMDIVLKPEELPVQFTEETTHIMKRAALKVTLAARAIEEQKRRERRWNDHQSISQESGIKKEQGRGELETSWMRS